MDIHHQSSVYVSVAIFQLEDVVMIDIDDILPRQVPSQMKMTLLQ